MNSVTRFFIIGALTAALAGNLPTTSAFLPLFPPHKPLSISIFHHDRPSSAGPGAWLFFWPLFSGEAPAARDDSYLTDEDIPLVVSAPGVLANDIDLELDVLTCALVAGPAHGALVVESDGSFIYTPTLDYSGSDSFTYTAGDGSATSNPATVILTISAVNDAPAVIEDHHALAEDTQLDLPAAGLLANDSDAEGDLLTAVLEVGQEPVHGQLVLNPDGSFLYTPNPNFAGADSFQYRASDGVSDSAPTTVSLTIAPLNDLPTALDDAHSLAEDTVLTVTAPGLLANDTDIEADALTAVLETGPAYGMLTLEPDGSFIYTPDPDYSGADAFTYHAADGESGSPPATVFLTVTPINDAPTGAGESYTTTEDAPLVLPAPGLLANDGDVEGDLLTPSLTVGPTHGQLSLNPDGSFVYTPVADYSGPDSFQYFISDGELTAGDFTATLTVTPLNDPPVAQTDAYSLVEDTPLTRSAPGLLANDTDIENDPLSAAVVSGPTHGTLDLATDGSFNYTPSTDYHGPDSFTYTAGDSLSTSPAATVELTITPVNDAPIARSETYTTNEDIPLAVSAPGLLANDTDADNDSLSAVLVSAPAHGSIDLALNGSFTYTPAENYHGADHFSYSAHDPDLASDAVTVDLIVTPVNDSPTAGDDAQNLDEDTPLAVPAPGVLANDSDVDGDPLTAVLVTGPAHGEFNLNADGSYRYTPAANVYGLDSFSYRAADADLSSLPATVTLTVAAVNDPPLALPDSFSTAEDTPLAIPAASLLANDSDIENDPLSAQMVEAPAHGSLTLEADGSFIYTPELNYNGSDAFTYFETDGDAESPPAAVSISITAVNDAPLANPEAYTTAEDTPLSRTAPGLLANDSDTENEPLSAVLVTGPAHGTLDLELNGSFTYTPGTDYFGPDSFTYSADDSALASETVTVALTVTSINDPPVALVDAYSLAEDAVLTLAAPGLLANDTDIENDPLNAAITAPPQFGALVLSPDGSLIYTPAADYYGPDSFTYTAKDPLSTSPAATVELMITPVNDAPIALAESYPTDEDTPLTVTLSASDVDGDSLNYQPGAPAHGDLALVSPGVYTYTPRGDYFGPDSFAFTANDGALESTPANVVIHVLAVNDAPTGVIDNAYTTAEESPLAVSASDGVLKNDSDVEADLLSSVLASQPAHGALVFHADGSFEYTPVADYFGEDRFSYYASDGQLSSTLTTVTILITNVNDAPVAVDDAYTTGEDTPLSLSASNGVQANDYDVDRIDTLTAVLDFEPAHGTLSLHEDGSFVYTPAPNYYGQDSFTYHLTDTQVSSGGHRVALNITSINDMPITSADYYAVSMGGILTVGPAIGLLKNDRDIEADSLQTIMIAQPVRGKIENFTSDGAFTYRTYPNQSGPVTFSYAVSDGQSTSPATTVTIDVPRPTGIQVIWESPARKEFSYQAGFYWVGKETIELRARPVNCPTDHCGIRYFRFDPTATGQQRFKDIAVVTEPPYTYQLDTSILNDDWNEIMALAYDLATDDPDNPDLEISDHFSYQAFDGVSYSLPATVTLTIVSVDEISQGSQSSRDARTAADFPVEPQAGDAPLAVNDVYETPAGVRLSIATPGLLANDTDPEGEALSADLATPPVRGSVTVRSDGSFDYIIPVGASPRLSIFIRHFPRSGPLPRLYLPEVRR